MLSGTNTDLALSGLTLSEGAIVNNGLFTLGIDAAPYGVQYRYLSAGELTAIQSTNTLRGGRPGETFFTSDVYATALDAERNLALPNSPEYRIQFAILNNPTIQGPQTVLPKYGQPGGGTEMFTTDLVRVFLTEIFKLNFQT